MSVDTVAKRAGITKPLIYSYFDSKEGLYIACLTRAGDNLVATIGKTLTNPDPSHQMGSTVLRAIFEALEPRPHDWQIIFDRSLPPGSKAEQAAKSYRRLLAEQAAEGIGATFLPLLPNALDQSALTQVWMHTVAAIVDWWKHHPDQSPTDMVARYERVLGAIVTASGSDAEAVT